MWVCVTCGVEHAEAAGVCAICSDERQWVPADGQEWATLEELSRAGRRVQMSELEPDLFGITVEPKVGIGQQTHLVRTPSGNLSCGTRSGISTTKRYAGCGSWAP
jgi:hypothetical protein